MSLQNEADDPVKLSEDGWPILDVWDKYENIAMHFNDLIIKLRTQALAGVAAISTLVTLFAKSDVAAGGAWGIAAFIFGGLSFAWLAIWIIDFSYYNRLLTGAVIAIVRLEQRSKISSFVRQLDISTNIEAAVANDHNRPKFRRYWKLNWGRWAFYIIVFWSLLIGFGYCVWQNSLAKI